MIDRERIAEFIDEYRVRLALGLGIVLVLLLFVFFAGLISNASSRDDQRRVDEEKALLSVSPEELFLPEEPFPLPGIQQFRTTPQVWSADEAKLWYNTPDTEMLDGVREPARRQIDDLLESVP